MENSVWVIFTLIYFNFPSNLFCVQWVFLCWKSSFGRPAAEADSILCGAPMPVIKIPYSQSESIMTCKYDRTLGSSSGTHVSSPPFHTHNNSIGLKHFFCLAWGFWEVRKSCGMEIGVGISSQHHAGPHLLSWGSKNETRVFCVCMCAVCRKKAGCLNIFLCFSYYSGL